MSIYIINSLYISHMNSIGFASPEDPATERVSGVIFPLSLLLSYPDFSHFKYKQQQ